MVQQGMFGEQAFSGESHWHDHEYQLDPHRLQIRESPRQQETAAVAQPGEEIVPRLLGEGVNKKKAPLICCVAGCGKDLSKEKDYYQRYRVCEEHLNLSALRLADGKEHRFCQQCGRFHPLGEFDGEKKSCRCKLQEHNNRRRKRPTAQEACHDLLEHRPRRTRRTTAAAGGQSENDAPAPLIRSQRVPRRLRTGPFAHLLSGDRSTSGSSGAAPRSSEHASDSSTREEPRETCSSQEGGVRSADLSALRQIAATMGHHPSSQSSREDSPRFVASAAVASQADEVPQLGAPPKDDVAYAIWLNHINGGNDHPSPPSGNPMTEHAVMQHMNRMHLASDYMQLPDIFSTNSLPPTSQACEDDLLQALYAQLGAPPVPPQPPPSNASHTSGPLFAENHVQPPLYAPGDADAQLASDGQVAYSQGPAHTQGPGPAQGGPDYQSLSQHLTDLERSIQSLKNQGLVDHLGAQEALNWQRHLPVETEAVCKPMLPVPPLQLHPDFEDHSRLDPAHQDDSMLLALNMLLDGSSTPGPSTVPLPMTGQLSLGPDFDLHPHPVHAGPLPLAGPKALSSPPHNLQRPQQLQQELQQQLHQQQHQQQPHRLDMADEWDALQRKYAALAQSSAGTDVSGMMVQPQYGDGRQQPSAEGLYHYHQYRLTPTQRVTPERVEMQAHLPMAPPLSLSALQDYTSAHRYQQIQAASAGGYIPIDDFSFLKGLSSGLLGADKPHLQSPQTGNGSHWTNQAPVQQHALQGQHVGGMQSLQTAGMPQPAGQGVPFTNLDCHIRQERALLVDKMVYQTGPSQLPTTKPLIHEPSQYMGRVNLKMLNQHPDSIPHYLLPHLSALSPEAQLTFLEGHMRPGCVHLVVDIMSTTNPAEWDVASAACCLMAFDAFWQHGTFLMQLPAGAVQWHDARIVKLWTAQELATAMPSLVPGTGESPMLHCLVSGQAARLHVHGRKARPAATATTKKEQSNAAKVLGRYMGKVVVNPDLQDCTACLQGSAGLMSRNAGEVVVPGLAGVGVLTLEAEQGSLLSAAQPVVVAPDVATQQDVCKLVMLLQAAGRTKDAVNLLLVEIGMVLQYHEHLLEADDSSNSDCVNDNVWEGPWVDSALLSSLDSDISEFPGSDNSTHCGVLSAAASAAAHSNASSMTNMSDDDGASEAEHSTYARTQHAAGSPSDSLMESLWRSGSEPMGPQRPPDHPPFAHPLYVAHMVRTAKKLVGLCQLAGLPALQEQVQEVASGLQPDSAHYSTTQAAAATWAAYSQQGESTHVPSEPAHASNLQSAAGAAACRFVLPTILESSIGSRTGSGTSHAASDCSRNFPLSPNGSLGLSELGFDAIDLPEIIEAGPSTSDSAQSVVTSQTTDATGRTVITVVTPEEIRVLKDSAKEVHEDAGAAKAKAEEEEQDAEADVDLVAQSRENATRMLTDFVEGIVQRAEPYIPARLQQLLQPQADQTGAADAQPARLPLLVSSKPILASLCLMMLAALLLLGYGFHVIIAASPRLMWFFASIIIMASMLRLLAVRHWATGLELVLNLHPTSARAYETVLPYCRLLRHAWQQACSGQHEQWDLIHSCAASCLSLAGVVIMPHQLAATWPNNVVLPGLVMVSILPVSAWVVHRDWYLAQRQHIQLALRCCTLALLCLATAGGLWTLPWWLLVMMHPVEGGSHQQLLALAEICVMIGHAISIAVSPAWSYWSFQGLLMLTLAFRMMAKLMLVFQL